MWCVLLLGACGGPRTDFIEGRVKDSCDQVFNVCSTVAGCALGTNNYVEGALPTTKRVIVQLLEPSTVSVHVYIDEVSFTGEQTMVRFFEEGCREVIPEITSGASFVAQANEDRSAQMTIFSPAIETHFGDERGLDPRRRAVERWIGDERTRLGRQLTNLADHVRQHFVIEARSHVTDVMQLILCPIPEQQRSQGSAMAFAFGEAADDELRGLHRLVLQPR